jgi:hypothetical protein
MRFFRLLFYFGGVPSEARIFCVLGSAQPFDDL